MSSALSRAALTNVLIGAGHMTESGLTRAARVKGCTCGADIVVGLDADRCAFEARADPQPLTELGEVLALLEGRRTWAVYRSGGRFVLDPRPDHEIRYRPAGGTPREDVLREHRCGSDPPAGIAASSFQPPTKETAHDQPPF